MSAIKYIVTDIYEEQIQSQEIYFELEHSEYNEELGKWVDVKGRYMGFSSWEAQEILDSWGEEFEFDHYPTIKEIEDVLLQCLKWKAEGYTHNCVKEYTFIYDTEEDDIPSNPTCVGISVRADKELFDSLFYEGNFEVYLGAISEIEVEEVEI